MFHLAYPASADSDIIFPAHTESPDTSPLLSFQSANRGPERLSSFQILGRLYPLVLTLRHEPAIRLRHRCSDYSCQRAIFTFGLMLSSFLPEIKLFFVSFCDPDFWEKREDRLCPVARFVGIVICLTDQVMSQAKDNPRPFMEPGVAEQKTIFRFQT